MVYDIFGAKGVNIEIPKEVFATPEELDALEKLLPGCEHGWFESSFQSSKLHYRKWLPKGEVKGVMVFCTGVNTHCGKGVILGDRKLGTTLLVDSFVSRGIAFYSFDYLGHGFSEGIRFYIPDWKSNKQDVINFSNLAASQHPNVPFFLGGESYGGNLAVHVGRHFQDNPNDGPSTFDSLLLTAPAIAGDLPPFPVYQMLRYVLAPMFPYWVPSFMPHPVTPERIFRDEEVRKQRTEPRVREMGFDGAGRPFRLGTALNLVLALDAVRSDAIPGLKVPFCILHGDCDYGVPIEGSKYMFDTASTPADQKELHTVTGGYHDLMTDPLAEEAIQHWMEFVEKRIKSGVSTQ